MKNFNKFLLLSAIMLLAIAACDKDKDDHEKDTTVPVISLTSPKDSSRFNFGDTLWIKGTITDNEIHESVISLFNDTTAAVMFSYAPNVHNLKTYTIDTFWKVAVNDVTKATLRVQAKDHSGNIGTAQRKLTLLP